MAWTQVTGSSCHVDYRNKKYLLNSIHLTNKNRRKAIFNWAATCSEGRGRLYTLRLPSNLVGNHCMQQNLM